MISITINTGGLENKIGGFNLSVLRPAMLRSVVLIEGQLKDYPAPRPGSRYRRTGTLGRRWEHSVSGGGNSLTGEVVNKTPYSPWVQSAATQAGIHKGRWLTDEQAATRSEPQIVQFFENEVERFLGG
ncbi:MAG: hypothetical protein AAF702_44485 [Chloroflexota bacterium]